MTEPDPGLGGKRSYWPRGKVLGGSSSINAMVYVRGHPNDYDDWAGEAPGWAWRDVEPVFRRMEKWSGGSDGYRGVDGPLYIQDIGKDVHRLCQSYLAAAEEVEIPINPDYNGASMEGAAIYQITTTRGLRASTARCYLYSRLQKKRARDPDLGGGQANSFRRQACDRCSLSASQQGLRGEGPGGKSSSAAVRSTPRSCCSSPA